MSGRFEGKVSLVTGAGSGIGRACALAFAREGAQVIVADVEDVGAEETVSLIRGKEGTAHAVRCDVSRAADVSAMVDEAVRTYGRLDCACNNAGIAGTSASTADYPEDACNRVISINLTGVWLCMKYEIPAMLRNGAGAVVNVSSIYGLKPSDLGHAPYCTSKYGLIGLSKTAAVDYGQRGIRVNVVAPGFTHTEMVDASLEAAPALAEAITSKYSAQRRLGDADETAQAISWLCSDNATFVNGAVLTVDGGDTARLY
jgi:NAD(P)-dependent dehydrogenase (short-subunit alcohol dehydrogenase family)